MNSTGFLTACIVALAGVSASLTPFAERAKNQETKKPGRAWKATGLFLHCINQITLVPRRADSFESPRYCRSPSRRQALSAHELKFCLAALSWLVVIVSHAVNHWGRELHKASLECLRHVSQAIRCVARPIVDRLV